MNQEPLLAIKLIEAFLFYPHLSKIPKKSTRHTKVHKIVSVKHMIKQ
jgi:hypothetical protein